MQRRYVSTRTHVCGWGGVNSYAPNNNDATRLVEDDGDVCKMLAIMNLTLVGLES